MRLALAFFAVPILSFVCIAQSENCGAKTDYVLNRDKPSVYIEFEQFGKADDWSSYHLGEMMKKPEIKKGNDIWLRLYNNSCWDITFRALSAYMRLVPDPANPGKVKLAFDLLDGTGVNVAYTAQEQDGRVVPWGGDDFSLVALPSGRSIVFPVYKEHLQKSRSIYVSFNYGWEKDRWNDNLAPDHHSFFWGYRMEEVKNK